MHTKKTKSFAYWMEVAALGIVLGLVIQGARAWTEPGSSNPPGGNVGAPINTGDNAQEKAGALQIDKRFGVVGDAFFGSNVGVGTVSPNPAKGSIGSIDVNDAYIRSIGKWASELGGSAGSVPQGAVMHFNLSACPNGWSELTDARGRYLVGLNPGGALGAAKGNSLSNLEDRPVGGHTHPISYTVGYAAPGGTQDGVAAITNIFGAGSGGSMYTPIDISYPGPTGTNAPYMQLLTCQKI